MNLIAAPADHLRLQTATAETQIVLYAQPQRTEQGSAGEAAFNLIRRRKLNPARRAWDLLSIALAAVAADNGLERKTSPDGWTRQIDLTVAVADAAFWHTQTAALQTMLRFLTTDIWTLTFIEGGVSPVPFKDAATPVETSSALLSGGLDSLIGALDLAGEATKPYLVSQVSDGDKQHQTFFASQIGGGLSHLQLNHNASIPGASDNSQRSRSLVFFAYGILVATATTAYQSGARAKLYASENGFISINPSLTPARLGSLSTRTTHPIYLAMLQRVLDDAGLRVTITNPYQHKTKGEMLAECINQPFLLAHAHTATSCGRYGRFGYRHCGRCMPCLIRRASFHRWGQVDRTIYVYDQLGKNDPEHAAFDDVRAAAMAVAVLKSSGIQSVLGASLASQYLPDPAPYAVTVKRGLEELGSFLVAQGVT